MNCINWVLKFSICWHRSVFYIPFLFDSNEFKTFWMNFHIPEMWRSVWHLIKWLKVVPQGYFSQIVWREKFNSSDQRNKAKSCRKHYLDLERHETWLNVIRKYIRKHTIKLCCCFLSLHTKESGKQRGIKRRAGTGVERQKLVTEGVRDQDVKQRGNTR